MHETPACEQVGFVLGKLYLLTVQENPEHDCFGPVRDRIKTGKGTIRTRSADFLTYALLERRSSRSR